MSNTATRAGTPSITRNAHRVIMAWTNELTGAIYARVSTDGGVTFAAQRRFGMTRNQPWLDQGDSSRDGFPTVAVSSGVINVAYYTSQGILKLRRSFNNLNGWTSEVTLTTGGNGYKPTLVAAGSTVVAGFAVYTGADIYTAFWRSTNQGKNWSLAAALSAKAGAPSYQPVISVASGTWRVTFERCLDHACGGSDVFYRESTDATSWTSASRTTSGPNDYQSPVGVTFTDAIVVTFMTFDPTSGAADVLSRRGS
jgi:hypothetical protein